MIADGRHWFAIRVFYEDTDAAGIVYYANYLKFVERARTEMMRLQGFEHSQIRDAEQINWTVRRCTIDYRKPARLDDRLLVASRIVALGGASLDIEQMVYSADGKLLVSALLKLACMRANGRPARLPQGLRKRLQTAESAPLTPQSGSKSS
ncbi:MAG: tol-pal system-associated acyl-CoA thioesterase [Rhodospirillales bacterium]